MIPKRLTLHDVCQYRDVVMDYKPGLTFIVGENGAGKTNLGFVGQVFGITGLVLPPKTKEKLTRRGTEGGHSEFVFEHDGVEYTAYRETSSDKAVLSWKEGLQTKKDTSISKVGRRMSEFLGMPLEMFQELCFVRQGHLTDVLEMTHSERLQYFQRLSGAMRAEGYRTILQTKLNGLIQLQDQTDKIQELEKEVAGLTAGLVSKRKELQDVTDTIAALTEAQAKAYGIITLTDAETVSQKRHELGVKAETYRKQIADITARKPTPPPEVGFPTPEDDRKYLAVQRLGMLKSSLKTKTDEYSRQEAAATVTVPEAVTADEVETLNGLRKQQAGLEAVMAMIRTGTCPTCKRAYDLPEDPKKVEAEFAEITELIRVLDADITTRRRNIATILAQVQTARNRVGVLAAEIKTLNTEIAGIDSGFDVAAYTLKKSQASAWSQYLTSVKSLDESLRRTQNDLTATETEIKSLDVIRTATAKEKAEAEALISDFQSLKDLKSGIEKDIAVSDSRIDIITKQLEGLRSEEQLRKRNEHIRRVLTSSRDLLHRENLPMLIVKRLRNGLNALMEQYLQKFNAPFGLQLDENFDFVASNYGWEDAADVILSGGQKAIAALSFHFAKTELLAESIPILVLDEPTYGIDSTGLRLFIDVLKSIETFTNRVYAVVITHETDLLVSANRILEVKK